MRLALFLSTAVMLTLTGCASSTADTPTKTVTVTVTPSATPSSTGSTEDELEAWAQQIESTIVAHNGTWEDQCQESDFPVSSCFIEDFGSSGDDQLTVTMDLTPDKVPNLGISFDEYREIQAEEVFLTIHHAFREIEDLPAMPEQVRVYDAQTEKMIGFADSNNGGLMEWYGG